MDLQSIAPASKTVPLGSGTVAITGLSLRKLTQLVLRFPELLALASGKIDLASLMLSAPDAALAIFSIGIAGKGKAPFWQAWSWFLAAPSEAAILGAFDEASTGQQIDLLSQIFEMTFAGERARPFLAGVLKMIRAPQENQDQNPPETSAPNTPPSSTGSAATDIP